MYMSIVDCSDDFVDISACNLTGIFVPEMDV
jgi:hypothetical protein